MHGVYLFSMVDMRSKRAADKDRDRQHAGKLHRYADNAAGADAVLYAAAGSMYGVYLFSMVDMRSKRAADEDRDRQHAGKLHRYADNAASADAVLHAAANRRRDSACGDGIQHTGSFELP